MNIRYELYNWKCTHTLVSKYENHVNCILIGVLYDLATTYQQKKLRITKTTHQLKESTVLELGTSEENPSSTSQMLDPYPDPLRGIKSRYTTIQVYDINCI